jgi:hypothetical protein
MEDEFAFSWVRTPKEWQEELIRRKEFDEQFEREWAQRKGGVRNDESPDVTAASDSVAEDALIT